MSEEGPQISPAPSRFAVGKAKAKGGCGGRERLAQGHTVKWVSAGRLQAKQGTLNQVFSLISGWDLGSGRLQDLQLQVSLRPASILGTLLGVVPHLS